MYKENVASILYLNVVQGYSQQYIDEDGNENSVKGTITLNG
ncbi:hypothetical protein ACERII_23980 [Evansella sp. AB-rgal1]